MSKTSTKVADKAAKASKALNKVKDAGVTKASQSPAAKSKAVASKVAAKEKASKKNKKKEPTPSSSSESESESDEDMKDASSSSSESESEDEKPAPKKAEKKVAAKKAESSDSSDSSDSDSSESEEEKPAPKKAEKKVAAKAESSDSSDSDSSESEEEKPAPKKTEKKAESSDSSDSDSSESEAEAKKASSDSESGSDSDSSDSDSEETPVSKKRKADEEPAVDAKKSKTEDVPEGAVANLFIGNLSWNVDEEWLQREFAEFGELNGVRIVTDRETGRSRGFGYVEYTNAADAVKAMEAKKGTDLDGRTINLDYAAPRQANPPADRSQDRARSYGDSTSPESDTLFVGNLPFSATEDALHEAFGAHGSVLGIRLPTEQETGRPKGFGYVQFSSIDEAKTAHAALNGHELEGRAIRLDFSTPRPAGGDRGGFGGRGRGGGGGFGGRGGGGRGGGRGGFGDRGGRGGGRGGFGDRGGRGGLNKGKGSIPEYKGTKVTF
ncbi:Nucleotide-binding alpha-beta plait [Penicillium cf. griseofulvum]|uniref:Nucleotide-binding alpha-beta plait n=1 Tax=Penicillium cf. griseofulvum TaxID=2972120 RepID=A0A9W9T6B9_9EURO|nr:Nucleotide-binding alpha-beta plait [Penicillium cf. griseofulvum]KAJ5422261.1 Nucleotide-binding alpha-beta plait [Penicillium cf. griseofulvum]